MRNAIFMYWENALGSQGMPTFVRLCINSVDRNRGAAPLLLLNEYSISDYLPDLRPEWRHLEKPAHKADYVRIRLVLKYGGMWLDSDMVALDDLSPLLDIPQPYDFACQDISSAIGCFVARPGCQLLQKVAEAQDHILDQNPDGFAWNGIGNDLLRELGNDYPYHRWPKWTVDEIVNGMVTKLLSAKESVDANVDRNAVVFHLCGELLGPLLDTYASHRQERLLRQQMLISKILRRGLGVDEPGFFTHLTDASRMLDVAAGLRRRLTRWSRP